MIRRAVFVALLSTFMPCVALATQASLYLGGGFSGSKLDLTDVGGGKDNIAAPGGTVGGQLLYDASKTVGVGIDLNFTSFGEENSATIAPGLDSTLKLKSSVVLAVAKWTALPDQPARPYLLGGLGFHTSSFKYEATPGAGFEWTDTATTEKRTLIDDTKSAFAAAFGVGIDLSLTPQVFLGMEARFVYLGKVTWDATSNGMASLGVNGIEGDVGVTDLMAKIGFRF